jgi:Hint domain
MAAGPRSRDRRGRPAEEGVMAMVDLTKFINIPTLSGYFVNLIDPTDYTNIATIPFDPTIGNSGPLNLGTVTGSSTFGAGTADLSDPLWRDSGSGLITGWSMNGTAVTGAGAVGVLDSSWTFLGIGDFTGSGQNDVLWRDTSGLLYEWQLNGTTITGGGALGNLDTSWAFVGICGFDGNGQDDVLWRQTSGGLLYEWQVSGTTVAGGGAIGSLDSSWAALGIGNFDASTNGNDDVLWWNSSGLLYEWQMNGTAIVGGGAIGDLDSSWSFLGIGDFQGTGDNDILWRNNSGLVYEWQMSGTAVTGGGAIGVLDTSWSFLGIGGFDGNGNDDVLWRNTSSGLIYEWQLSGTQITAGGAVGVTGSSMTLLGIGAFGTIAGSVLAIAGAQAGQIGTDQQTILPFATLTVTDAAGTGPETAVITMLNNGTITGADGALFGAGLTGGGGSFTLSASSAAALTTAMDSLVFTPTRGQVPGGQTVATSFSITVSDSFGFTAADGTASVIVQNSAVPPTITGSVPGQVAWSPGTILPFGSVTIGDANFIQSDTVTVTLSAAANGTLSNLGGGSYNPASGVWSDGGTPAQVTAALRGLVFTPTASLVAAGTMLETNFTITDTNAAGLSTSDATTSVWSESAPSGSGLLIEAGYYDLTPSYGNPNQLPVPWIGAPLTTFVGDAFLARSSDPDEGAFLIDNTGTVPVVLTAAAFSNGGTVTPWTSAIGAGQTIPAGGFLILSGTTSFDMDGSENTIPGGTLIATINGTVFSAVDTTNILRGWPAYDETLPWTPIATSSQSTGVTCFAEGTLIRTPCGDVPVERLIVGEPVLAADGAARPVVWIGRRRVDCLAHPRPEEVWPVRVAAGAFGEGLPARDLWLSPDHAVHVDGVLVPVKRLADGDTIARRPVDEVTYYHVELPSHELILAEGLTVESYLDTGDRWRFDNGPDAMRRVMAAVPRAWEGQACAPLVLTGPALAKARRSLKRAA